MHRLESLEVLRHRSDDRMRLDWHARSPSAANSGLCLGVPLGAFYVIREAQRLRQQNLLICGYIGRAEMTR